MAKYSFIVFISLAVYSFFIILFSIFRIVEIIQKDNIGLSIFFLYLLGGVILLILSIFALNLKTVKRINISITITSLFITAIFFESLIEFRVINLNSNINNQKNLSFLRNKAAEDLNVDFDKRNKLEVIKDFKEDNISIIPNPYPKYFSFTNGGIVNGKKIFPVNGISNITTILNNENGYYTIYKTDEFGFNNPEGSHINKGVDIVIIGDSFGEGYSVKNDESLASQLKEKKLNLVNLSRAGNGPLIQLATLIEYAKRLEPKIVLWLYNAPDIRDLSIELNSEILKKYLYNNFTQNLIKKQDDINNLFKKELVEFQLALVKNEIDNNEIVYIPGEKGASEIFLKLSNIIKFSNLRRLINFNPKVKLKKNSDLIQTYLEILQKAKENTLKWGGKFYFVNLPQFEIYNTSFLDKSTFLSFQTLYNSDFLLSTIKSNNFNIIDIDKEGFRNFDDPKVFFPFNLPGHYNAKGYDLSATVIYKSIEEDLKN